MWDQWNSKPGGPFLQWQEEAGEARQLYVPGTDRYSESIRRFEKRYPPLPIRHPDACESRLHTRMDMRSAYVCRYSWAIPCDAALERIAGLGVGVVEAGAGTGYWASLMGWLGVDVFAYDQTPVWSNSANSWHSTCQREWHPVHMCSVEDMPWTDLADRALFLCWPPYSDPMGADAVRAYAAAGGALVITITEGSGGCCGDQEFWKLLEGDAGWGDEQVTEDEAKTAQLFTEDEMVFEGVCLPRWDGVNDLITAYRRR